MIGLELVMPLLTDFVRKGVLSIARLSEALSAAPARIIGIEAPSLAVGAVAELTLVQPDAKVVIDKLASKSKNTPFWGKRFEGAVALTLAGGRVIHDALP